MVQAEVIEQGDEPILEPGEEEPSAVEENEANESDIVTELPETTNVPPHPRPQVFAEIIEEEIIEEETVEVSGEWRGWFDDIHWSVYLQLNMYSISVVFILE